MRRHLAVAILILSSILSSQGQGLAWIMPAVVRGIIARLQFSTDTTIATGVSSAAYRLMGQLTTLRIDQVAGSFHSDRILQEDRTGP
jgi:hypothetical protein